jgi:transposase
MLQELLFTKDDHLHLDGVVAEHRTIILDIRATSDEAPCPACGTVSSRVHSRYLRAPRDLPVAQQTVRLRLNVRRFRCEAAQCARTIFAERFPTLIAPFARRTKRLEQALREVALALGGEAGARLGSKLGLPSSPNTLLRLLRRTPLLPVAPLRSIGIDEWAWRKGRRYGTIITNLESHHVVALLADDKRETVAAWLRDHPTIKLVSRDRSGPFATAVTEALPDAIQVADRFHLVQNVAEALKHILERHARRLDPIRRPTAPLPTLSADRPPAGSAPEPVAEASLQPSDSPTMPLVSEAQRLRAERLAQRQALHHAAHDLKANGMAHAQIARTLGVARRTVLDWLRTPDYQPHPGAKRRGRSLGSQLDPYKAYLQRRFHEGCQTASVLWREIQVQGFGGSASLVRKFITPLRATSQVPTKAQVKARPTYSIPDLVFSVLRRPQDRPQAQASLVAQLQQVAPALQTACALTEAFVAMVRDRAANRLDEWLTQAEQSEFPEFHTFVRGLRRDLAAVRAGLELSENNGLTEGHVNRLKLIKRTMYGRANFDLLQRRVLLAA